MVPQDGGCLCGALRYAASAPPVRVTVCHCRFCQRGTGTAYFVEPIFDKPNVALTVGHAKIYAHRSEGSGKIVTIHFCDTCGTKLFLTFERFPDFIGVFGGTFDDPNWFERAPENTRHIFLESAQHGTIVPPGYRTYREHAMSKDGGHVDATIFDEPHVIERGGGGDR